jgi:beta-lactamase regulating signal transducer with metallopeptidase domain
MAMLLVDVAVRATLIALGTASILWALRIRTAAVRHAAWTSVVIAMLLLPIWSAAGLKIALAVLPAGAPAALTTSTADVTSPATDTPSRPASTAATTRTPGGRAPGELALIGAYAIGVFALLLRLGIGTVRAHKLRRTAVVQAGRATSARCATPITVGWLAPVLILPRGWERWSGPQLDAVLTHEREHARRRDPLVQWLALLNRAIFWFHPLAWWLERRLATLAEEACDAAVIRAGHSPQDYSGYLIEMARALRRQGRRVNVAGMAMPGSGLTRRMRHIFEESLMTRTPRTRVICTLAFCAMSSTIFASGILTHRPAAPATSAATAVEAQSPAAPAQPAPETPRTRVEERVKVVTVRPNAVRRVEVKPHEDETSDFSGTWTLVSSTYAGRGRGGTGVPGEPREVNVRISSGAPVNCGGSCTIVQDGRTLTITRLDPAEPTDPDNGVVTLHLDGRTSTITQPGGGEFTATAKTEDAAVIVSREINSRSAVTQTLSIEGGRLKVVTMFRTADAPVTMTYVKK